jgi:hypothetical protein
VVMARRGLERADVALLIVDGEMGVTQGDATIASYAEESGRSVIIVVNKWDLAIAAAQTAANREGTSARGKARRIADRKPPTEIVDRGQLLSDYEEIFELRADCFFVRKNRRPRRQAFSLDRPGSCRAEKTNFNPGAESLAQID